MKLKWDGDGEGELIRKLIILTRREMIRLVDPQFFGTFALWLDE